MYSLNEIRFFFVVSCSPFLFPLDLGSADAKYFDQPQLSRYFASVGFYPTMSKKSFVVRIIYIYLSR